MIKQSVGLALATSSCVWNILPAQAINVTFNTLVNAYDNVSSSANVNTKTAPNGLNNFFSSNFLLLGAKASDTSIPSDSFRFGESLATSTSITIVGGKDYQLTFDWAFRGNSNGQIITLPGVSDVDIFTLSFVGIGSVSNIKIDVLTLSTQYNQYGSKLQQTYTLSGNELLSGTYNVVASLTEAVDLTGHSSAAGLDNFTIEQVPFEFSPSQGLLIVGGFGLFFYLKKKLIHR